MLSQYSVRETDNNSSFPAQPGNPAQPNQQNPAQPNLRNPAQPSLRNPAQPNLSAQPQLPVYIKTIRCLVINSSEDPVKCHLISSKGRLFINCVIAFRLGDCSGSSLSASARIAQPHSYPGQNSITHAKVW